jgi:hypothetical protein
MISLIFQLFFLALPTSYRNERWLHGNKLVFLFLANILIEVEPLQKLWASVTSGAQVSEVLNPNCKYQTRMEMIERVRYSSLT